MHRYKRTIEVQQGKEGKKERKEVQIMLVEQTGQDRFSIFSFQEIHGNRMRAIQSMHGSELGF